MTITDEMVEAGARAICKYRGHDPDRPIHPVFPHALWQSFVGDARAALEAAAPLIRAAAWHKGEPPKPWRDEWFIAETTYGDRVVLRALPEEWTYDYKTADETYIMADKIARWMQFPDSAFKPAPAAIRELKEPHHD